jgi:hypothetical protein
MDTNLTTLTLRISDRSESWEINGGLVDVWAPDSHHILPLVGVFTVTTPTARRGIFFMHVHPTKNMILFVILTTGRILGLGLRASVMIVFWNAYRKRVTLLLVFSPTSLPKPVLPSTKNTMSL